MKHAVLSPSASHRWLACPGSIEANRDKPYEENKYAIEGTTAHALLEASLILGVSPEYFLGMMPETGLFTVTEEMAYAVGYAVD